MFYLGIDVAKAKLDCCLLLDEASSKRKTKVIYKTSAGYLDLLAWPAKQQVTGCGTLHDRDVNAAKNILRLGHQSLAVGIPALSA